MPEISRRSRSEIDDSNTFLIDRKRSGPPQLLAAGSKRCRNGMFPFGGPQTTKRPSTVGDLSSEIMKRCQSIENVNMPSSYTGDISCHLWPGKEVNKEVNLTMHDFLFDTESLRSLALVTLLLDRGLEDVNGHTALHVAAGEDDCGMVELLLHVGVDYHKLDRTGRTALGFALFNRKLRSTRTLIEKHPDIIQECVVDFITDVEVGSTIFHDTEFISSNFEEVLAIFGPVKDRLREIVNIADYCGNTPLHRVHSMEFAKFLIDCGAELNAQNCRGETPLHCAFGRGNWQVALLILHRGADVNIKNELMKTPLQCAFDYLISRNLLNFTTFMVLSGRISPADCGKPFELTLEVSKCEHLPDMKIEDKRGNTLQKSQNKITLWLNCQCKPFVGSRIANLYSVFMLIFGDASQTVTEKDRLGRNPLHNIFLYAKEVYCCSRTGFDVLFDTVFRRKSKSLFRKWYNDRDEAGRTPAHYAAMVPHSLYKCSCVDKASFKSLLDCEDFKAQFDNACLSVADNSGRKPVDYGCLADIEAMERDASTNFPRKEEWFCRYFRNLAGVCSAVSYLPKVSRSRSRKIATFNNCATPLTRKADQIKMVWKLWKTLNVGDRTSVFQTVVTIMNDFMTRLVEAVGKEDPRLKGCLWPIGSAFERTKIGFADEFDFNVELINFTGKCTVDTSDPNHCKVPGFYVLRREDSLRMHQECNEFFDNTGRLLSRQINRAFHNALINALSRQTFWNAEPFLDVLDNAYTLCENSEVSYCKTLTLRLMKPLSDGDNSYLYRKLSVDIVPVIRVVDWLPSNLAPHVKDNMISELDRCFFVCDQPYRKYRIPYTATQYVRLSFGYSESLLIRDSSEVVRAALMVAKYIVGGRCKKYSTSSYVLKMALLWSCLEPRATDCDERLNDVSIPGNSLTPEHLYDHVEALFQRLNEFSVNDYVPLFFIPSLHIPVWKFEKFVGYSSAVLSQNYADCESQSGRIFHSDIVSDIRTVDSCATCSLTNAYIAYFCASDI